MRLLSCSLLLCAAFAAAADDPKAKTDPRLLFNGKNLDGWQTKAAGKNKPESLEGKTEAFGGRFAVKDGMLVLDPKVKGDRYIETVRQFSGDFIIRYDFKPEDGCNNDTLLLGTKFDIVAGAKNTTKGVKLGAWNTMEVVVKGGSADFLINGQKAATQKTKADKGPLTLRAEFGAIAYKDIRLTAGK
jgi:hypothetical protein